MSAWDTKTGTDKVASVDFNTRTTEILRISGNYTGHSSNTSIHSPSSNLKTWFDTLYVGGSDVAWSGASEFYGFSSNTQSLYHPSAQGDFPYISTQSISGVRDGNLKLSNINASTDTLDKYLANLHTSLLISGGAMTLGTPTGSVNIGVGYITIRKEDSDHATVELVLNGTPQGGDCDVSVSGATQREIQSDFSPLSISSGDWITFRTTNGASTAAPCQVCAWFKMTGS